MDKNNELEKLERQRMEYLEVGDSRTAGRIKSKIQKIENEIELEKLKDIKKELNLYKKYINKKGLANDFLNFCIVEWARD